MFLGDRAKVEAAIAKLEPQLNGRIMRRYGPEGGGLYRGGAVDGVGPIGSGTPAPDNAVAGYMDPLTGEAAYLVKDE